MNPLADRIRPKTLDEVVGQAHLLDKGALLRRVAESGNIPNMIFYGPPGTGKTTVASIIAKSAGKTLYKLNGTTMSIADIREVTGNLDTFSGIGGVLLYIDEIQYLNKKQQQSLLEFIENGRITLIASTTENPYFYIYSAILSRSTIFEFKPVAKDEIKKAVERAFHIIENENGIKLKIENGVCEHIASLCGGDVRKAINAVELLTIAARQNKITLADAEEASQKSLMKYDRDGDEHYDIMSALQKSVRGSDTDAALHYLARLLEAGDIISPCRRLLVMASEDIGMAYPMAAVIVKSCVDSAMQLGLPEARIPLAQAVITLCTAPKSNSAIAAIDAAIADIKSGMAFEIPANLRDSHYKGASNLGHGNGYIYPHDCKNHWVKQQYLPDKLVGVKYYRFGDNKTEQAAKTYWDKVKSNSK